MDSVLLAYAGLVASRTFLSKLKNLFPNFTWDLVATSSHDPEVIFNFFSYELSSSNKDLLSKGLPFAIPPKQIRLFELYDRI